MNEGSDTVLQVSRVIRAVRAEVFCAWTQPDLIRQWSCPEGASVLKSEVDLRVGGEYRIHMRGAEGALHTAVGVYREIEPPARLIYTWSWLEADMMDGETRVTVDFKDQGESTEVVITHEGFPGAEATEGHRVGWESSLVMLDRLLD